MGSEINVWPFQKINLCVIIWRHNFDLQDIDGHTQTEIYEFLPESECTVTYIGQPYLLSWQGHVF